MTAQEKVIATALAQVGYFGKKTNAQLDDFTANKGGRFNKFARDLDALGDFYNGRKNGYDWCDVFVDWCFVTAFGRKIGQKMLYQPDRSCGAGTKYSMNYYKAKGRFFASPQPGDQIFFGDAKSVWHTGLVTAVSGEYVSTVEGNAGTPSAVRQCRYVVGGRNILGYGRPDWSIVPEERPDKPAEPAEKKEDKPAPSDPPADQAGDKINTEEDDEMLTYEQWKQHMERYRKELGALPASNWAKKELGCAITEGVTDGQRPRDLVTREEAAIMVLRGMG